MENLVKKDSYKISRIMYIIEAMVEYFVALGIGTFYLAKLAKTIGVSPALIAIIEAFVSLGATFRIFAILLTNKRPVKIWVTTMHVISQTFFALIWFVPLFNLSKTVKTVMLIGFMLIAYVLHNLCYPAKTNMYMDCVDFHKRGSFTATKEMVSLAGGMIFTLCYGNMITYLEDMGKKDLAFVICGALLLVFMVIHTLTLIFAKEKVESVETKNVKFKAAFKQIFTDKKLLLVISVYSFYSIAHYIAYPFYAEYQISEVGLGFTTGFASLIAAIGSIVRFIASKPVGRIADKYSFNKSMTVCFCFLAAAYAVMVFTVPANGKYMYLIYVILTSVASAGITSGVLNITYDYVSAENRTAALAINGAVAGLIGFVTTVAITPLFNYISSIREQGGKILGLTVYPTQLLSLIAFVLTVGLVIYNIFVIGKLKRNDELNNAVSEK